MSDTRYLILLPLKYPDGTPVPREFITEAQVELARRYGGATLEPARVSGMWMDEGLLVEDELIKLWTDVDDSPEVRSHMVDLRVRLQRKFRQKVIYVTSQPIRIP